MKKLDYKKFLPHAALILGGILVVVGLFVLVRVEEAKTRDTIRMQEVISVKQGLYRYYVNHAAYPPSGQQSILLGTTDSNCLSDKGFLSSASRDCSTGGGAYLLPVPNGTYTALGEQGDTPCNSLTSCPRYAILFFLETDLFARKGMHALTPEGLQ